MCLRVLTGTTSTFAGLRKLGCAQTVPTTRLMSCLPQNEIGVETAHSLAVGFLCCFAISSSMDLLSLFSMPLPVGFYEVEQFLCRFLFSGQVVVES